MNEPNQTAYQMKAIMIEVSAFQWCLLSYAKKRKNFAFTLFTLTRMRQTALFLQGRLDLQITPQRV